MSKIAKLARERCVPLVMVAFPVARQVGSSTKVSREPQRWLAEFCQKESIPLLDLLPACDEYARERALTGEDLFPDGLHPNAMANQIAAEEIHDFILAVREME